jgi:hypothetical protein
MNEGVCVSQIEKSVEPVQKQFINECCEPAPFWHIYCSESGRIGAGLL